MSTLIERANNAAEKGNKKAVAFLAQLSEIGAIAGQQAANEEVGNALALVEGNAVAIASAARTMREELFLDETTPADDEDDETPPADDEVE